MGLDLPDLKEFVALVAGDKETFKKALADFWRSLDEWKDENRKKLAEWIMNKQEKED